MANALTKPGSASMLGSPVDLSKIDVDSYVVAGIDDHIHVAGGPQRRHEAGPAQAGQRGAWASEVSQSGRAIHPGQRAVQGLRAWCCAQDRLAGPPVAGVIDHCAQARVAEPTQQVGTGLFPRAPGRGGLIDVR